MINIRLGNTSIILLLILGISIGVGFLNANPDGTINILGIMLFSLFLLSIFSIIYIVATILSHIDRE